MFKELKETMLKGLKEGMKIIMLIKGLLHPEDITAIKKNIHLKTAPKCMKQKLTGFIEEIGNSMLVYVRNFYTPRSVTDRATE